MQSRCQHRYGCFHKMGVPLVGVLTILKEPCLLGPLTHMSTRLGLGTGPGAASGAQGVS